MNDILAKFQEYWKLVATRAIAYEKSTAWHRHLGAKLGGIATALSALARSSKHSSHQALSSWLCFIFGGESI